MSAKRYVSRPVEIDAVLWTGNLNDLPGPWRAAVELDPYGGLIVHTLEGPARARRGSYIVRGTAGEFYPVRADIFATKYQPVGGA